MKYVMGLIISFALCTASFAQDSSLTDPMVKYPNSSAKFRPESPEPGLESDQSSAEANRMYGNEVIYGTTDDGFSKMERLGRSGSVYYFDDPSTTEENVGNIPTDEGVMEENKTEVMTENKVENTEAVGDYTFGKQCALNKVLEDRQGEFNLKRNGKKEDIEIKRDKNGNETVKFDSDNEYYKFKGKKNGLNEYDHTMMKNDEVIEVRKHKDGSADVYYEGHFDNLDNAKVLEEGFKFEEGSVCNSNIIYRTE